MNRFASILLLAVAAMAVAPVLEAREMTRAWVIPAAANKLGVSPTDWHTDLTLYNPHKTDLLVRIDFLPTGRDNSSGVPSVTLRLSGFETRNFWDVLGPDYFQMRGSTGALLVYADESVAPCPQSYSDPACDFAVFSRTYTLDPFRQGGEYGQALPGFPAHLGVDWSVPTAYLPQLSDDRFFRTNLGVASWTNAWVRVRVDLEDAVGAIVDRRDHDIPPYGHVQWSLEHGVTGGTAAVYLVSGPDDSVVYPYASVVNWESGDPVYVEAQLSPVGIDGVAPPASSAQTAQSPRLARGVAIPVPPRALPVSGFSLLAPGRRARFAPVPPADK